MDLNSFERFKDRVNEDLKSIIKSFYVFGDFNTLFVTIDDKVFGLGSNDDGVCGQGYGGRIHEPIIITELCDKSVIEFFNGYNFVLCLTSDNKLFSWGNNYCGQLGIGSVEQIKCYWPQLITCLNNVKIMQVCCGGRHSLVLTEEGVVYGWGDNWYGQTGVGEEGENAITKPTKWQIESKIIKIHCSEYQSFAITSDGNVYCCGENNFCQLGSQLEINEKVFIPRLINIENVESIATSKTNTYFVTRNGDIYYCGQYLNDGKEEYKKEPFKISNLKEVKSMSSSNYYLNCLEYAIVYSSDTIHEFHHDKMVKTYKFPKDYKTFDEYILKKHEMTNKSITITSTINNINSSIFYCKLIAKKYIPQYIRCENNIDKFEICDKIPKNLKKIIKYFHIFKTSYYNSIYSSNSNLNVLFVTIDDNIFGLGGNKNGVLGLGHNKEVKEVEIIPELCDKSVKQFFNGSDFCLCLTSDNKLFSWGYNDYGQLGIGQLSDSNIFKPQLIEYFNDKTIVQICCGYEHSSVLTSDGRVYLWGYYNGFTFDHPIECELIEEIKSIHCSLRTTLCLTKSGNVYYWKNIENDTLKNICITTISNIKSICSSDDYYRYRYNYTYLISNDSIIYVFKYEITSETEPKIIIRNFNFGLNFQTISVHHSNCVIYSDNTVYELYQEECYETKYKNPFDYYCDRELVTFGTIEMNVKEKDILSSINTTSLFLRNSNSQVNDLSNILKPFSITNGIDISKYNIRYLHIINDNMLFVTEDDEVYGFGYNEFGCCGLGNDNYISEPQLIKELYLENVIKFFCSTYFTMALTINHVLYAWGRIGNEDNLYSKPRIILESEIDNITCSANHALILTKEGNVFKWGNNIQIESGQRKFSSKPLKLDKLAKIKLIGCNDFWSYAVSEDNQIFCWNEENVNSDNYDQMIVKYTEEISNICVSDSFVNNLYILTEKRKIYYLENQSKTFKEIIYYYNNNVESIDYYNNKNVESIHSIKFHQIIAIINGFIYRIKNKRFESTKYTTIHDFNAQEFQLTYKTIDLKLQNEIQVEELQIEGNFVYLISLIL